MGINWVTFIAQIVNLCVLVWLLKRFLYQPILNAVDKRQAEISDKVNRAAREYESAKADHAALEQQRADFEKERQQLFDQTTKEVARLKKEQLAELAALKAKMTAKIESDLARDAHLATLKIRDTAAEQFRAMAERLIESFGSISPIEQAAELFKQQLNKLSKTQVTELSGIANGLAVITLMQSGKLTTAGQKDLNQFIKQKFKLADTVRIKTVLDDSLILGFEMRMGDMVTEWNLKAFSEELRHNMNNALNDISSVK